MSAPQRYGVFNSDGPVEYGYASMAMAETVAGRWRDGDTPDAYAAEMCPEHEGQQRDTCAGCSARECRTPRPPWGTCIQALASGWILTGDLCPACTRTFMRALDGIGVPLQWSDFYTERAGAAAQAALLAGDRDE